MDVLPGYLEGNIWRHNPSYVDRGMSDVDLVDVLDGMMCRGHMSRADAEQLLHEAMQFGYDFNPPQQSGTCP